MEKEIQTDYVRPLSFMETLADVILKRNLADLYGDEYVNPRPTKISLPVVHGNLRDMAVECPDTTYYDSSQLVYFRIGDLVYKGYKYETPDGRVEHVPRYPLGIPASQVRDMPKRSSAPR